MSTKINCIGIRAGCLSHYNSKEKCEVIGLKEYNDLDFVEYHLQYIRKRITELRIKKGVSEREMSLTLGKGPSFVNQIVSGKNNLVYKSFLEICEYFEITPYEFFEEDYDPIIAKEIYHKLNDHENGAEKFYNGLKRVKKEHLEALLQVLGDI